MSKRLFVMKFESHAMQNQILMKKATHKTQNFYILPAFLLVTIALLIAVSIDCYLIKYRAKEKYLLPFHFTNIQLKI